MTKNGKCAWTYCWTVLSGWRWRWWVTGGWLYPVLIPCPVLRVAGGSKAARAALSMKQQQTGQKQSTPQRVTLYSSLFSEIISAIMPIRKRNITVTSRYCPSWFINCIEKVLLILYRWEKNSRTLKSIKTRFVDDDIYCKSARIINKIQSR